MVFSLFFSRMSGLLRTELGGKEGENNGGVLHIPEVRGWVRRCVGGCVVGRWLE